MSDREAAGLFFRQRNEARIEVEQLREALRLLDEFDRYASTTGYAGTPFEAEVTAYLKSMGLVNNRTPDITERDA